MAGGLVVAVRVNPGASRTRVGASRDKLFAVVGSEAELTVRVRALRGEEP